MAFDAEEDPRSRDLRIIHAARDRLHKRWGRSSLRGPNGAVCTLGALIVGYQTVTGAKLDRPLDDEYSEDANPAFWRNEVLHLVNLLGFETCADVVTFNDDAAKSKREVLAVFDETVRYLEAPLVR